MQAFAYEDGQWYFHLGAAYSRLPVAEEEVNQAEERFRFRFKFASALSWVVTFAVLAWVYVRVIRDDWPMATMLAFLPAFAVSTIFYMWATISSTRSLRKRLMELERQQEELEAKREAVRYVVEDFAS